MKGIFGRSSGPRHPLIEAGKRTGRRRATGADLEAFFRRLLSTPLHLATHQPAERLDEADVMVLDLGSEEGTALPTYLDPPATLVALGQIGGWVAVRGSDACRIARERLCHELAVFSDPERDPELVVQWDAIDWLGAGLVRFYERNASVYATLLTPVLEDACHAAAEPHDEIAMAQLIEGVPAEEERRAVILATVSDNISPRRWFEIRSRIETGLLEAGHIVTIVTEPEAVIMETHMAFDEWSRTADERGIFIK